MLTAKNVALFHQCGNNARGPCIVCGFIFGALDHCGQAWVNWKCGDVAPEFGRLELLIYCTERLEKFTRLLQSGFWRGIGKTKCRLISTPDDEV